MMLWPLPKRTRIALSTINAQSLGVRYARPCSAEDKVERSSSIGLDMARISAPIRTEQPTVTRRPTTGLDRDYQKTSRPRVDQVASFRFCSFNELRIRSPGNDAKPILNSRKDTPHNTASTRRGPMATPEGVEPPTLRSEV